MRAAYAWYELSDKYVVIKDVSKEEAENVIGVLTKLTFSPKYHN